MSDPQIYVRGFSKNTRQTDLKELFGKYGSIRQVRIIRDYAFIVFTNKDDAEGAVKGMDGEKYEDYKLRVQVAGKPKKTKGPQPNDQCRFCRKLGHWQNNCPEYRDRRSRYSISQSSRRRRRSYSSSSSSSSSDSDRSRRHRRKSKKIKKHRKRSYSSSSSSSSGSSSSRSSSGEKNNIRREKPKELVDKEK